MKPCLTGGEFFGDLLRRETLAGLVLTETGYAPRTRTPRHCHANPFISLVRIGAFTEVYNRHTRECTPRMVVFHPAGEVHTQRFHDTVGQCFNIELLPAWVDRVGQHARMLDQPLEFNGGQVAALAAKVYDEFARRDAVTPLAVEGLTLELLARAARSMERPTHERRPPAWLRQVHDLLHDHFSEDWSLPAVAATVGVHPAHLAVTFRRHYRRTVGDYLRHRRVEAAGRLLAETERPLPEIALAAGFTDHSQFSRTFKILTGTTPSRYRRSAWARTGR